MAQIKNGIQMYFHCKICIENKNKPNIGVGWTIKGVQVWCENCNVSIIALDFMGNKVGTDSNPESR